MPSKDEEFRLCPATQDVGASAYRASVLEEDVGVSNVGQIGRSSGNVQGFQVSVGLFSRVIIEMNVTVFFGDVNDEIIAAGSPDGTCVSGR